jgi:hypothetical protein
MGIPMGFGDIGGPKIIFKRKFRWTFEIQGVCGGNVSKEFVKIASRPNLEIEETEINHLHSKFFIPGKATWQDIEVTYYDVNAPQLGGSGSTTNLYSWIASIYDIRKEDEVHMSSMPGNGGDIRGYSGKGILTLYDGCGDELEQWTLNQMWPKSINFGELDYSSSEECTIVVSLKYRSVIYVPKCGGQITACCDGCANG